MPQATSMKKKIFPWMCPHILLKVQVETRFSKPAGTKNNALWLWVWERVRLLNRCQKKAILK